MVSLKASLRAPSTPRVPILAFSGLPTRSFTSLPCRPQVDVLAKGLKKEAVGVTIEAHRLKVVTIGADGELQLPFAAQSMRCWLVVVPPVAAPLAGAGVVWRVAVLLLAMPGSPRDAPPAACSLPACYTCLTGWEDCGGHCSVYPPSLETLGLRHGTVQHSLARPPCYPPLSRRPGGVLLGSAAARPSGARGEPLRSAGQQDRNQVEEGGGGHAVAGPGGRRCCRCTWQPRTGGASSGGAGSRGGWSSAGTGARRALASVPVCRVRQPLAACRCRCHFAAACGSSAAALLHSISMPWLHYAVPLLVQVPGTQLHACGHLLFAAHPGAAARRLTGTRLRRK